MYGTDEDRKAEAPTSQLLEIVGMSCSHCQPAVSAALTGLAGVSHISVEVAAGTALVESSQPLDMGPGRSGDRRRRIRATATGPGNRIR
jgi:hypothetical protein